MAKSSSPTPAPNQTPTFLKAPEAFARMTEEAAVEAETYTMGVQAVIWGTQWVKAAEALRMFSTPLPDRQTRSPYDPQPHAINVWGHPQKLLNADMRIIETPNTETLYSTVVIDLQEPVVLVHPDFGERYFRTSIWDIHGDTHTICQKQDGAAPPPYVLTPVGWKGTLPAGMKSYAFRSRYLTAIPHIAVYGEDDLPNVYRLQQGLKVGALKDWGKSNAAIAPCAAIPPLRRAGTETPPDLMFFEELCEVLKLITIREDELGFARQVEGIGITLKDGFQIEKLDAATIAGLKRAISDAQAIISHRARALGPVQPGGTWAVTRDLTVLDNWLGRAAVGFGYVWGDLDSEILYPMARADDAGQPLSDVNKYVLHFAKSQLPPAKYWRISMYDIEGFFFNNPINRYGIGNMAEKLAMNDDGSLTITIQRDSPGRDKETNWLPAPKNGFFVIMRLYQPEARMYRGEYTVPGLHRVQ